MFVINDSVQYSYILQTFLCFLLRILCFTSSSVIYVPLKAACISVLTYTYLIHALNFISVLTYTYLIHALNFISHFMPHNFIISYSKDWHALPQFSYANTGSILSLRYFPIDSIRKPHTRFHSTHVIEKASLNKLRNNDLQVRQRHWLT